MTNDTNIAIIYQRYCNDAETFTTTPAIIENPNQNNLVWIVFKEIT